MRDHVLRNAQLMVLATGLTRQSVTEEAQDGGPNERAGAERTDWGDGRPRPQERLPIGAQDLVNMLADFLR